MAVSRTIHDFFVRTEGEPDRKRLLSSNLSSTCISAANKTVLEAKKTVKGTKIKRHLHQVVGQKAEIARFALQNGNNVAVKYYSKKLEKAIKESSVRTWLFIITNITNILIRIVFNKHIRPARGNTRQHG